MRIVIGSAAVAPLVAALIATLDAAPAAGAPADGVRELLAAARGVPPIVCALAARSIGQGWSDGADAPVSAGLDTRSPSLSFAGLGDPEILLLANALGSSDPCEREMAVRVIARQPAERVAPSLLTRLRDGDDDTRAAAAAALGMVRHRPAVDHLIPALASPAAAVRANAAWALGRIRDGRALAPITTLMHDPDVVVRGAAVATVGQMDSISSAQALIRVLQQDEAASVRRTAAWALVQLRSRVAIPALAAATRDADHTVREMAVWGLAELRARDESAAVAAALARDSEARVRETAAWALGELGDRSAVAALANALDDRDRRVRGTAAWAIGMLRGGGQSAPPSLVRLLKDDSDDVRLKAAWALGELRDRSSLAAIREAIRTEQGRQARRALLRAYVRSGGESGESMMELLSASDPELREVAIRGLVGRGALDPWPWPWPRPRPFP
jgi:HEAT repeat protein